MLGVWDHTKSALCASQILLTHGDHLAPDSSEPFCFVFMAAYFFISARLQHTPSHLLSQSYPIHLSVMAKPQVDYAHWVAGNACASTIPIAWGCSSGIPMLVPSS